MVAVQDEDAGELAVMPPAGYFIKPAPWRTTTRSSPSRSLPSLSSRWTDAAEDGDSELALTLYSVHFVAPDADEDDAMGLAMTPPAVHFVTPDAAEDDDPELASVQPTFRFGAPGTDEDEDTELAAMPYLPSASPRRTLLKTTRAACRRTGRR